jgi:hypothetical protein
MTMISYGGRVCRAVLRSAAPIQRPALWQGMMTEKRIPHPQL